MSHFSLKIRKKVTFSRKRELRTRFFWVRDSSSSLVTQGPRRRKRADLDPSRHIFLEFPLMVPEDIQFPPHTSDTEKCRLLAGAIPPPFARQLSLAAAQFQQQGAKRHSLAAMMLQLAVSEKGPRPVFVGGVEWAGEKLGGLGSMHMPEEYAPFQRQTNRTTAVKSQSLRRMKNYVSDWGSNEPEWMESAKLFEDACTEVRSQNEVLKRYPTQVLSRTEVDTTRRTVPTRRVRRPWWDSSRQVVSNSTSSSSTAIWLTAKRTSRGRAARAIASGTRVS